MTKSSVDRKRSRYGEKYSLRFHKQLKIYHLTCNDESPSLIAKFVETDGYLAMKLFERLESNYKENEQLKIRNKGKQAFINKQDKIIRLLYNQCKDFKEILDDSNITYPIDERLNKFFEKGVKLWAI